jgi:hypothetical protein
LFEGNGRAGDGEDVVVATPEVRTADKDGSRVDGKDDDSVGAVVKDADDLLVAVGESLAELPPVEVAVCGGVVTGTVLIVIIGVGPVFIVSVTTDIFSPVEVAVCGGVVADSVVIVIIGVGPVFIVSVTTDILSIAKAAGGKFKPNLKVGRERRLIIIEIYVSIAS